MKQKIIDITASIIAKRIAKILIVSLFNAIGIFSVVGIPIVAIVDFLFLLMLLQTIYGYAIMGGNILVIIAKKTWIFVKYSTLIVIIFAFLTSIYAIISKNFFSQPNISTATTTTPKTIQPQTAKQIPTDNHVTENHEIASQPLPNKPENPTTEYATETTETVVNEPLNDIENTENIEIENVENDDLNGEVVDVNININNVYHPENEPDGLYIVEFSLNQDIPFTYRIYCQTNTVRNITDGEMGISRKASDEDNVMFGEQFVLRQITEAICH